MTIRIDRKQDGRRAAQTGPPPRQGLYDPQFEHEACGVGFVVNIKGRKSHAIIQQALQVLLNLNHRGACGCEANTGDGAGILIQPPHEFLKLVAREARVTLPSTRSASSTTSRFRSSDRRLCTPFSSMLGFANRNHRYGQYIVLY